jgi:hypothetical protein
MTIDIPEALEKHILRLSSRDELSPQEYALRALICSVTEDSKVNGRVPNNLMMELYLLVELINGPDESDSDAEFEAWLESKRSDPQQSAAAIPNQLEPKHGTALIQQPQGSI